VTQLSTADRPSSEASAKRSSSSAWGAFLRTWLVMFVAYTGLKLAFNLGFGSMIDLRATFLYEIAFMPLGLAVVLWVTTRRARAARDR
jgi:hypothetical protein